MRIIFAGSGEFGVPALTALARAHEIVQVYSQPDRPAGRGRKLQPTPISALAMESNLPLVRTGSINGEHLPPADLMVVIAFGQKISAEIANAPRLGSVNLHASLLPKYRGAAPIHAAIVNGETVTGNSVIRLAQKMDAGAILAQSRLQIGDAETAGEMHDRLAADGPALILKTIDDLATGTATERPQDDAQATLAPKLGRQSTRIDWAKDADSISRQIRGLYPWPGCRVGVIDGDGNEVDRLTLVRARAVECSDAGAPGVILSGGNIRCGSGAIELLEVHPQSGRPMSLADYRRGHRWDQGLRLQSIVDAG